MTSSKMSQLFHQSIQSMMENSSGSNFDCPVRVTAMTGILEIPEKSRASLAFITCGGRTYLVTCKPDMIDLNSCIKVFSGLHVTQAAIPMVRDYLNRIEECRYPGGIHLHLHVSSSGTVYAETAPSASSDWIDGIAAAIYAAAAVFDCFFSEIETVASLRSTKISNPRHVIRNYCLNDSDPTGTYPHLFTSLDAVFFDFSSDSQPDPVSDSQDSAMEELFGKCGEDFSGEEVPYDDEQEEDEFAGLEETDDVEEEDPSIGCLSDGTPYFKSPTKENADRFADLFSSLPVYPICHDEQEENSIFAQTDEEMAAELFGDDD